jgi:hypothetical protein
MRATIPQSNTEKFKKSVSTSIKSLFNPGSRTYFVLEHKTNSEKHRIGESSNFLSDYIEIGRGDKYAVNFGDDCKSVSRPHAAISRKDSGWMLTPISKTNATILNGKMINNDTTLSNGDEIQLSSSGPKISFLIPSNPSIKTLGFTVRFKAAMNEAIRPYKTAIATIVAFFVLAISGLSTWGYVRLKGQDAKIEHQAEIIARLTADAKTQIATYNAEMQRKIDSLSTAEAKYQKDRGSYTPPPTTCTTTLPYNDFSKSVYFIVSSKLSVELEGEIKEFDYTSFVASGFLLEDGSFVTARHVTQPWLFGKTKLDIILSAIQLEGKKISLTLLALSPSGDRIELKSDDFSYSDNLSREFYYYTTESGDSVKVECARASLKDGSDWAVLKTGKEGGLPYDNNLSTSLPANTNLEVLGYSLGMGANNLDDIKPLQSACFVSRPGLDRGKIDISNRGFDQGNSGGPVFARTKQCNYVVIGIVSAEAGNQGIVVPIKSIH